MASKKPTADTTATGEDDLLSTKKPAAKPAKTAKPAAEAKPAKPVAKAKPAKAAAADEAGDDLLSTKSAKPAAKGKAKVEAAAKPAATKAKPATPVAAKGKAKAAKPAADDADDLLDTKPKSKAAAKPAAKGKAAAADKPAKKPAAPRPTIATDGTVGTRDDVRAVLLKIRKATSFADIASTNNFNVRMVRRCSRALKAEGLGEITREGTTGMWRKLVQPAA